MRAWVRNILDAAIDRSDFLGAAEMAHATGATLRQLQVWDEKGCVKPAHGTHRHVRRYSPDQIPIVLKMVKLRRAGVNLVHANAALALEWDSVCVVDRPTTIGNTLLVPPSQRQMNQRKRPGRIQAGRDEESRLERIALRDPEVARGRSVSL